ncbi:MAG: JAB domain-containing protein, partial [Parachlamydiaceae bacterium]
PREVFYPAIRHKAASLILIHNHPSGDLTPSKEDYDITELLIKTGNLMSIPVHDHLIISANAFISLRQKGFEFFNVI